MRVTNERDVGGLKNATRAEQEVLFVAAQAEPFRLLMERGEDARAKIETLEGRPSIFFRKVDEVPIGREALSDAARRGNEKARTMRALDYG